MELNIGGKDYTMRFGIGFLNELDKCYPVMIEGQITMPFYDGLNYAFRGLKQVSPVALFNVIRCGVITNKSKPSNENIELFLEDADLEELAESFFTSLKSANMTKLKVYALEEQFQRQMNNLE